MAESRLTRGLAVAVVILLLVVNYQFARSRNQQEIALVQAQMGRVERERDSIRAVVAANAEVQETLRAAQSGREAEIQVLRDHVGLLETERYHNTLTVRRLRKTSDLQRRLEETFPEMANSNWGITTIPFEPNDTLGLEYLVIPAWFTETFIIDHQNAESWREQKDELLAVDSLRTQIAALQDSIATLHSQNTIALQAGYENGMTSCREMSTRYIAQLRKPTLSIGSTLGVCLAAAGAGLGIGTVFNR